MTAEPPRRPVSSHIGVGYLHAVISGDADVQRSYEAAFTAPVLLEAAADPIRILARYLGYHLGLSRAEVADALMTGHLNSLNLTSQDIPE